MIVKKTDIKSPLPPTGPSIAKAASALQKGLLVAIPTETVYGLGANAADGKAVARIFEAKGRPRFNPLIVHVLGLEEAEEIGEFNATAKKLAAAFWPGPFTMVVPKKKNAPIADLVTAGLDTVAIRVPSHPVARDILRESGLAIAAPSANLSGELSPTSAEHISDSILASVAVAVDGGQAEGGLESTICAVYGGRLTMLRPGLITPLEIERIAGQPVKMAPINAKIQAPGQLKKHYAPKLPVRLNAKTGKDDEFLIGFGPVEGDINLSASENMLEAAANLFSTMHKAEVSGKKRIAVAPIPDEGLGIAINDRLGRAASTIDIER